MIFYHKVNGLNEEERLVVQSIERLIKSKRIPTDKLRVCKSFEELVELDLELLNYVSPDSLEETNDVLIGKNEEEIEPLIPSEDNKSESEDFSEHDNEEQQFEDTPEESEAQTSQESELDFVSNDYDPFSEEIIERSYNTSGKEQLNTQSSSETANDSEELDLKEASSTPVDNLNPKTKQRAAEQTADAILKGYARIAPMPFKYLAKVDEAKVEQMSMNGQIDINIEVEDGMTFDEYMRQTNEQVDEIFTVEEDTLEEIREPLIEVLMEQQMELTPQQRLMMAVISHLFQMLTVALKLRKQNNRILQYQKHITQMQR